MRGAETSTTGALRNTCCVLIKLKRCTNSQIYFWNRTLHVSDRFFVHHHESNTVHTAISICHTGFAECLLASSQKTCMTYTYSCVYSARLMMMDKEPVRNMQSSIPKINLRISVARWFYFKNISRCTVLRISNLLCCQVSTFSHYFTFQFLKPLTTKPSSTMVTFT